MNTSRNFRPKFWFFPFFALIAALALGAAVQWLWNAILPSLLGVASLSFWQAVGLLVLCRILFGNFSRGSFGGNERWKHRRAWRGDPSWRRDKWANMTPEERERFREEWRKRCNR